MQEGLRVLAMFLAFNAQYAMAARFDTIAGLPGFEEQSTYAWAVSRDGSTVVGWAGTETGIEAFRWTRTAGILGLGYLPNDRSVSQALGSSMSGHVVIGSARGVFGSEAVYYSMDAPSMVSLGDLPGGLRESEAYGVSADGRVVVGFGSGAQGTEPFRWEKSSGMLGLGHLRGGGLEGRAYGVSADGSVVVGFSDSESGSEAFRWTAETGMVGLGDLPGGGFLSLANRVSADGSTVVGMSEGFAGYEAFRWTAEDGMLGLGALQGPALVSAALGTSLDGSVVVGRSAGRFAEGEAFVWTSTGGLRPLVSLMLDHGLDPGPWKLTSAADVSDDGLVIAGWATNTDTLERRAFVLDLRAQPVPEPNSLILMTLGTGALVLIRVAGRCRRVVHLGG